MIVYDAHKRNDVGALRQRVAEKISRMKRNALEQPCLRQPLLRALGYGGQVEQHQAKIGRAHSRLGKKNALTAADVEQATMLLDGISVERLLSDERLRGRHESAIGRDLLLR